MTYRVIMVCDKRTLVAKFAGCTDEADAKDKAKAIYGTVKFKKVELVKAKE